MSAFTPEQIKEHSAKIVETLKDDFQLSDLAVIVPLVMEITERVTSMSNEDKHATAEGMIDFVLAETDLWGPDAIIDPIAATVLKALIPVVAKLAKGGFKINQG